MDLYLTKIENGLEKYKMTKGEFAKRMGISRSLVSKWFSGRNEISDGCKKRINVLLEELEVNRVIPDDIEEMMRDCLRGAVDRVMEVVIYKKIPLSESEVKKRMKGML